jgi:hypothetical protein
VSTTNFELKVYRVDSIGAAWGDTITAFVTISQLP